MQIKLVEEKNFNICFVGLGRLRPRVHLLAGHLEDGGGPVEGTELDEAEKEFR